MRFPLWLPDGAVALRRRTSRSSLLPGEGGDFWRILFRFWLQGQTGSRTTAHSHDVVCAIEEFAANPRCGEVYNLGGGRENSISMHEAITKIAELSGKKLNWKYVDENRKGDHICYISDLSKFKSDYPNWKITIGLDVNLPTDHRPTHPAAKNRRSPVKSAQRGEVEITSERALDVLFKTQLVGPD